MSKDANKPLVTGLKCHSMDIKGYPIKPVSYWPKMSQYVYARVHVYDLAVSYWPKSSQYVNARVHD